MSLKLVKLDVVVHVVAGLEVYLCCSCLVLEVVAISHEGLMAGTRIGKEIKRKRARRAGIPQRVSVYENRFLLAATTRHQEQ